MTRAIAPAGRWIIALTGASGARYGLRLLAAAAERVQELHVVLSDGAFRVLAEEEGIKISPARLSSETLLGARFDNIVFHNNRDIGASIASGSGRFDGMVIAPCSMSTLAAVAHGLVQNLVHRAADVTMKEGRKLVVVPRETPLSAIHLENMLKLSRIPNVTVLPAMPGFYHQPTSVEEIVDMLVMKILDQMGVDNSLARRWKETPARGAPKLTRLKR